MPSDDDSDDSISISERETQFVPRSDDDEVLWEVQEITAERGKKYKVKWVGVDPATGNAWPQSWVAKHDCTDKLVAEWKIKKKLGTGKKSSGRPSTKSRSSVSSKSDRASATKKETRRSAEKVASSSRLRSVEEDVSPPPPPSPPKKLPSKRKGLSETSAVEAAGPSKLVSSSRVRSVENLLSPPPKKATSKRKRQSVSPAETSKSGSHVDERHDPDSARPRKKQKSIAEALLPPLDSDEEDARPGPKPKTTVLVQKSLRKRSDLSSGDEYSSPPKGKPRVYPRKNVLPEDDDHLDEAPSKTKAISRDYITNDVRLDRETASSESKATAGLKRKSPSAGSSHPSEKEVELVVSRSFKIGPPRGAKRQEKQRPPGSINKPASSYLEPQQDSPPDVAVVREEVEGPDNWTFPDSPVMVQDLVDSVAIASSPRIQIPPVQVARPRSPDLSPGARARLELFDRMMVEPDDAAHDYFDPPRQHSPPPVSPPKSTHKPPKPNTPNGLVVPETESSRNSESQSQPISKPLSIEIPPAPESSSRRPMELPAIAVISASTPASTTSVDELFPPPQRLPPVTALKKPTFKPVPQISPRTFRSRVRVIDEPPPSSIESFASPKRVDKGKQKAVEVDTDLSDNEDEDLVSSRQRTTTTITDSVLRKRGRELSNQHQERREAEWKKKKSVKRLKDVDSIINGSGSSPAKLSLPFTDGDNAPELSLTAGGEAGNSMTLDTLGQSIAKPLTEMDKDRLRIELRQEEEESTQEALGYPTYPPAEPDIQDDGNVDMSPPRWSKDSPIARPMDDIDPIEQPSGDFQQASVLVQASQEHRHEDMDTEPPPTHPTTSSPARPIPQILTDSPKRRLGKALSLLNVKSEEIQRLELELSDARRTIQGLTEELAQTRRSPKPSEADIAAWELERADWLKAREILEARVAVLVEEGEKDRAERLALEAERAAWMKVREEMKVQHSEELASFAKVRSDYDWDRAKWEAEKISWVEEKTNWELERATLKEKEENLSRTVDELTTTIESLTAVKTSAEKDREFFREQYAKASGFVGSVCEENLELEKRVKIAEGQAREGVEGIKLLFEGHIKALQMDVERWKAMAELLQERDRRTNDELRSRAAQAPELEELCERLTKENSSLEADLRKIGQAQQRTLSQRNKLYYEILMLKKERASLKSKISQVIKAAGSSQSTTTLMQPAPPPATEEIEIDPNDMEILPDPVSQLSQCSQDEPVLLPCLWRPQLREQCQQIFDTKEDLERHLRDHYRDLVTQ